MSKKKCLTAEFHLPLDLDGSDAVTSVRVSMRTAETIAVIKGWLAGKLLASEDAGVRSEALGLSRNKVLSFVLADFAKRHLGLDVPAAKGGAA